MAGAVNLSLAQGGGIGLFVILMGVAQNLSKFVWGGGRDEATSK